MSFKLPSKHIEKIYTTFILPVVDYGDLIYNGAPKFDLELLESAHYRAACSVSGVIHGSSTIKVLNNLNWSRLEDRRKYHIANYCFKVYENSKPSYVTHALNRFLAPVRPFVRELRGRNQRYIMPARISKRLLGSPIPVIAKTINSLLPQFETAVSFASFKHQQKTKLFKINNRTPTTHLKLPLKNSKLLNRMRVGLILKSHKHAHNFRNTPTPRCPCGHRLQNEKHFFLDCALLTVQRQKLFGTMAQLEVLDQFNRLTKLQKWKFLLYGEDTLTFNNVFS